MCACMERKVVIVPIVLTALLSACGPAPARTAAAATVTAAAAAARATPIYTKTATPPQAAADAKATPTGETVQAASLPSGAVPPEAAEAVAAARDDLQTRLGLSDGSAIVVQSVEAVDWPDSSLGCPAPGKMYAQAIKPGFLIILTLDGSEYEYHTNEDTHVVLCEDGAPAK